MALSDELRNKKIRSLETVHPVLVATGLRVLDLDRGYARVRMRHASNGNHVGTLNNAWTENQEIRESRC